MSISHRYIFFLFLCIFTVLLLAIHPAWKQHLIFDIYTFQDRASYFIHNFNLSGVNGNEYQPGAILYFILLSPTMLINPSFESFLTVFFVGNILLLLIMAFFIRNITEPKNLIIFGLLILFTGPILFYRFELLVILLTIISFYLWTKNKTYFSVIFLALASLVKVYPVIYLPYFLILIFHKKGFNSALKHGLVFVGFILIFTWIYLTSLQVSIDQLIYSLDYHSAKPIGVEGIWSGLITTWDLFKNGLPPSLVAGNKTWGINPAGFPVPIWLIDNYWIFIVGIIYVYLLFSKRLANKFMEVNILLTITLVTFAKLTSPQYLMWYLFLLPLINFDKLLKSSHLSLAVLFSFAIAFLSQYIYPLNYTDFLQFFSGNSDNLYLFYINLVKNILLVVIFVLLIFDIDEKTG